MNGELQCCQTHPLMLCGCEGRMWNESERQMQKGNISSKVIVIALVVSLPALGVTGQYVCACVCVCVQCWGISCIKG